MLIYSIAQALPVLTPDSEDFEDLHDLVIAAAGHHAGILVVRFDNDPRHNLTDRGIATALSKLGILCGSDSRPDSRFEPVAMNAPRPSFFQENRSNAATFSRVDRIISNRGVVADAIQFALPA